MAEYIEREALEVALNHRLNFLMAENGEYDHYTSGFDEAVTIVEDFPAADVAPVAHSYWESYDCGQYMGTDEYGEPKWRDGRFYVCHNYKCRRKTVVKSKYCPNCGAKMDEKEDTHD